MRIFNNFLNFSDSSNSAISPSVRAQLYELRTVICSIVKAFMCALKQNHLLVVESLFQFQSRQEKDMILSNYAELQTARPMTGAEEEDLLFGGDHGLAQDDIEL